MKREKIVENFWNVATDGDRALYDDELGWPETLMRDAQSDYPETIFRYVIEVVGFNLLFYWTADRNFYTIETENIPTEVRRIYLNPNWDGRCEFLKSRPDGDGPNTCSPGEVLASFADVTRIWDELRIDGIPIGEVLDNSAIIEWD